MCVCMYVHPFMMFIPELYPLHQMDLGPSLPEAAGCEGIDTASSVDTECVSSELVGTFFKL